MDNVRACSLEDAISFGADSNRDDDTEEEVLVVEGVYGRMILGPQDMKEDPRSDRRLRSVSSWSFNAYRGIHSCIRETRGRISDTLLPQG